MAAVMAALAAKTASNRVIIIEPSNVLGGQGTAGGVAGFCGDTGRVNRPFAELIARLSAHDLIEPFRPNDDRRAYDLEWCAFFLQEMITARGVEVLLHARVIAAHTAAGRVDQITVSSVGGLLTFSPRFVIDASGACVVPRLGGFEVIHEGANRQLPMSLYFTLWNTGNKVTPFLPDGCPRWANENEIPMTSVHAFSTGKVEVKMKVVGFDAADSFDRSAAEIFARRQMHGLIYYLQTSGYRSRIFDTHVLAGVSRGIGVREERRIVGEHVLTEEEVRRAVIFPDAVAVNTYHIDYHWPDKMERAGTGITDMLDPHHVPLRMMIPKGAKNLLVPGRGASGDQTAMSAFRVMAVVAQMGFAAGHAARQCLETGTEPLTLDLSQLQAAIIAGGQSLDLSDYGEYLRRDLFDHEPVWGDTQAFTAVKAPALVQLSNARFLAAWIAQKPELKDDSGIWVAERREKSWSLPRRLASVGSAASLRLTFRHTGGVNVDILISSSQESADGRGHILRSTDDGATWSGLQAAEGLVIPDKHDAEETTTVKMSDGALARVSVAKSTKVITAALSTDDGRTWSEPRKLETAPSPCAFPTVVATHTGIAFIYVQAERRLFFWHGSVERILHGPPTASAHALQA
jgi:hypothetical protein